MSEFLETSGLLDQLMPLIMMAVGAGLGYGLKALRAMIAASSNKLDDAIWNKLVGEFTAAGVISQEQLKELKAMPGSEPPKK